MKQTTNNKLTIYLLGTLFMVFVATANARVDRKVVKCSYADPVYLAKFPSPAFEFHYVYNTKDQNWRGISTFVIKGVDITIRPNMSNPNVINPEDHKFVGLTKSPNSGRLNAAYPESIEELHFNLPAGFLALHRDKEDRVMTKDTQAALEFKQTIGDDPSRKNQRWKFRYKRSLKVDREFDMACTMNDEPPAFEESKHHKTVVTKEDREKHLPSPPSYEDSLGQPPGYSPSHEIKDN